MKCETTTCISKEHFIILNCCTKKYKRNSSVLLTSFLRYIAENQKISFAVNKRISYRKRNGACSWQRIHIMLNPYDYEIILDLKKFGKMSLAKIIEFGIENFFQEFVNNVLEKQNTDNYLYANYHYEITTEENIFSYCVYWGLPLKILKKITKSPDKFAMW
ncbi:MAG: hypothetical protein N3F66_09480 [Spirochaetes bacterium]|nr:hypothetical protein [Spirochaetota bacterium]